MSMNKDHFSEKLLSVNGASDPFLLTGYCDLIIQGLTSGSVKLQYLLPKSPVQPAPSWVDFPTGQFVSDIYKTIFVSEHGVMFRFLGVSNNASVYVRMARFIND